MQNQMGVWVQIGNVLERKLQIWGKIDVGCGWGNDHLHRLHREWIKPIWDVRNQLLFTGYNQYFADFAIFGTILKFFREEQNETKVIKCWDFLT